MDSCRLLTRIVMPLSVVALLTKPAAAKAEEPAYQLQPTIDAPVSVVAGTVAAGWLLRNQLSPAYCHPLCDRTALSPVDRNAAGLYNPAAGVASDVGLGVLLAGSFATLVLGEGPKRGINDAVVVGETVLVGLATSTLADVGFRRPRPYMYSTLAPLDKRMSGDGGLSFFSGHTTAAAGAAVAIYSTMRRIPELRPYAGWALMVGASVVVGIGIGRIASGNHFPTDVLAGAVVGSSYGILIPALHKTPVRILPSVGTEGPRIQAVMTW